MNRLLLISILLTTTPVFALEGWVDIPLVSIHTEDTVTFDTGETVELNELNLGIGITVAPGKYSYGDDKYVPMEYMSYRVGVYNNSYNRTSVYAGINPHTSRYGNIMYGVMLGVVSGYDITPNDSSLIMAVVPHVSFQGKHMRTEVSFIKGKKAVALALTVGFRF